jgi:hypothetical protein
MDVLQDADGDLVRASGVSPFRVLRVWSGNALTHLDVVPDGRQPIRMELPKGGSPIYEAFYLAREDSVLLKGASWLQRDVLVFDAKPQRMFAYQVDEGRLFSLDVDGAVEFEPDREGSHK